jgi:hypothetical protein
VWSEGGPVLLVAVRTAVIEPVETALFVLAAGRLPVPGSRFHHGTGRRLGGINLSCPFRPRHAVSSRPSVSRRQRLCPGRRGHERSARRSIVEAAGVSRWRACSVGMVRRRRSSPRRAPCRGLHLDWRGLAVMRLLGESLRGGVGADG